jgi:tripartite-type tricarboxylate transporter receptor subunit TctC
MAVSTLNVSGAKTFVPSIARIYDGLPVMPRIFGNCPMDRTMSFRTALVLAIMPGVFVMTTPSAHAQTYPSRPIRLVVGAAAGGGTDFVARAISPLLGQSLGQSIVIDNRGGAAGTLAGSLVAGAPADGHTLLMMTSNFATFPKLYKKLDFHPLDSFAMVSNIAVVPYVLVVNPNFPAKSTKELIAYAKTRAGQLNYASSGVGSMGHLAGAQFGRMAGIQIQHVTYKGAGPAVIALLGEEVQLYFSTLPGAITQIKSGRLRALAIASRKRSKIAPDLPTVAESALPGFEASSWFGVVAPRGTPAAIVDDLYRKCFAVLQDGSVLGRLAAEGMEPIGNTPAEYRQQLKSDIDRWSEVIRSANIVQQ